MPKGPGPSELEQRRRDLKGGDPFFYQYISLLEQAKALDAAGDAVTNCKDGYEAANLLWGRMSRAARMARTMEEGGGNA